MGAICSNDKKKGGGAAAAGSDAQSTSYVLERGPGEGFGMNIGDNGRVLSLKPDGPAERGGVPLGAIVTHVQDAPVAIGDGPAAIHAFRCIEGNIARVTLLVSHDVAEAHKQRRAAGGRTPNRSRGGSVSPGMNPQANAVIAEKQFVMRRRNFQCSWGLMVNAGGEIIDVRGDSPAYLAGLSHGCRITAVDSVGACTDEEIITLLKQPALSVRITVALSSVGEADTVLSSYVMLRQSEGHPWGMMVGNNGLITDVKTGSPAQRAGLVQGTRVVTVDDEAVRTPEQLIQVLRGAGSECRVICELPAGDAAQAAEAEAESAEAAHAEIEIELEKAKEAPDNKQSQYLLELAKQLEETKKKMEALRQQQRQHSDEHLGSGLGSNRPPKYWVKLGKFPSPGYTKVPITDRTMLYRFQQLMDYSCRSATLGQGRDQQLRMHYSRLAVQSVYRIQNDRLWVAYTTHRDLGEPVAERIDPVTHQCRELQPWLDTCEFSQRANECYLWHGTKPEIVDILCAEGFDERVCSLGGLFGAGAYFAEHCSKSDQYCTPMPPGDRNGTFYIFLARVAMGKFYRTNSARQNERRAPHGYDSVLGQVDHNKYREFIVYDGWQCFPEYLIEYRRV